MYIFGHLQGLNQKRRIFEYFSNHWRAWFPALPSYQAFNQRLNQLLPAFELFIEEQLTDAARQIQAGDDRLIDSLPIMLANGKRANRATVAPDLADVGFCATKSEYYHAVKLHIIAARRLRKLPLPERIHLSKASKHDLQALRELDPRLGKCALFADKAYSDAETKRHFKERGTSLLACVKRKRNESLKDVLTLLNRFISATRQPIESLFGWLIQRTDIQNASKVRSSNGLLTHCYGKLCVACFLLNFYS